jgi:hypothetical protein
MKATAFNIGAKIGCDSTNAKDILQCFREKPAGDFINASAYEVSNVQLLKHLKRSCTCKKLCWSERNWILIIYKGRNQTSFGTMYHKCTFIYWVLYIVTIISNWQTYYMLKNYLKTKRRFRDLYNCYKDGDFFIYSLLSNRRLQLHLHNNHCNTDPIFERTLKLHRRCKETNILFIQNPFIQ